MTPAAWPLLEAVLVATIVLACAVQSLRALWPAGWRRVRLALAVQLLRTDNAHARALARRLVPAGTVAATGCGPCRGCDKGR